jgi:hypothetical protein
MTLKATSDMIHEDRAGEDGSGGDAAAVVRVFDGQSSHWDRATEGHLLVSVETIKHGIKIWAIMKGGGNDGTGCWFIPSVGTEVMLGFDRGEVEGDVWIESVNGKAPSALTDNLTLLIGGSIQARSAGGSAQAIATKADVQAVVDYLKKQFDPTTGHVHATPSGPTTTIAESAVGAGGSAPDPVGTTVFEAE